MLRPVNRNVKSRDYILPAPIGGLNRRDSLAAMPPQYAIVMDNYIPMDNKIILRSGYNSYVNLGTFVFSTEEKSAKTGVRTLVSYKKPNDNRLIALYNRKAYNVSSPESIKEFGVEFSSVRCQTVQYKNYLYFMNGLDTPKVFYIDDSDVEHFEDWGFTSESLQPARIVAGAVSKEFLWFVEKNTLKAWYSATAGSIAGELKAFDLSQISKYGGELVAIANWTIDGGVGIDDLTAFITSEGEVLVYSGSNPDDANDWAVKGSYKMSKPIVYKCVLPYQGDIVIISEDGYIPLSKA